MRTAHLLPYGDRDPPYPGQRPPHPGQRPPGKRPHSTETPWTENPWTGTPRDRDRPGQRPPVMSPVMYAGTETPPCEQSHRQVWKHYLAATSLRAVINWIRVLIEAVCLKKTWNLHGDAKVRILNLFKPKNKLNLLMFLQGVCRSLLS